MPRRDLGLDARARLSLVIGVALVVAGLVVTLLSAERVAYGAVIVGALVIARAMRPGDPKLD